MSTKHPSNFWSRFMGTLFALAALAMLVTFVMKLAGWGDWGALLLSIYVVIMLVAALSYRRFVSERHRNVMLSARPAEEVLARDRPYIVYLRSFGDEQRILKRFRRAWPTEEEQIAAAVDPYGSLIAIRDPAGKLPTPGATRLSASGDTWQDKVRGLVDNAAFVVVRLGESPGVLWELGLVLHRLPPSRVLLLSALTADAHAAATAMLKEHFDIRLPKDRHYPYTVSFDEDWSPAARPLHYWNLRGDRRATYLQVALQAVLVPFFRRLGFEAELPPVRAIRIVIAVFMLLGTAVVCWGFLTSPLSFIFGSSLEGVTMSAGFIGFMFFSTIVGIVTGVFWVYLFARSVAEIWFPERFMNQWWWGRLGKNL